MKTTAAKAVSGGLTLISHKIGSEVPILCQLPTGEAFGRSRASATILRETIIYHHFSHIFQNPFQAEDLMLQVGEHLIHFGLPFLQR